MTEARRYGAQTAAPAYIKPTPARHKRMAEERIESVLDAIAAQGREPGRREARQLEKAVDLASVGMFDAAMECAAAVLGRRNDGFPVAEQAHVLDARRLRRALAMLRGRIG